jgi:16S rRNA (cytosine1402-N4)-methyltransferase
MTKHIPVLLEEVLASFSQKKLKVFFDGTLGLGGHARAILEAHPEIETYIGCDQDENALSLAKENLQMWKDKIVFVHKNFSKIDTILDQLKIPCVDGFLCDIGVSSMQLDQGERGFSFSKSGPLDMRMDQSNGISAKEVVNTYSEVNLGKIIKEYGEERHWKIISKLIVEHRKEKPFETTDDLAGLIQRNVRKTKKHLHSATLVFQALRIYVNDELGVLKTFLKKSLDALCEEAIGAMISFHSLEDRIVKEFIKDQVIKDPVTGQKQEKLKSLTRKPVTASQGEKDENPRARSAKLRAFVRVGGEIC